MLNNIKVWKKKLSQSLTNLVSQNNQNSGWVKKNSPQFYSSSKNTCKAKLGQKNNMSKSFQMISSEQNNSTQNSSNQVPGIINIYEANQKIQSQETTIEANFNKNFLGQREQVPERIKSLQTSRVNISDDWNQEEQDENIFESIGYFEKKKNESNEAVAGGRLNQCCNLVQSLFDGDERNDKNNNSVLNQTKNYNQNGKIEFNNHRLSVSLTTEEMGDYLIEGILFPEKLPRQGVSTALNQDPRNQHDTSTVSDVQSIDLQQLSIQRILSCAENDKVPNKKKIIQNFFKSWKR